MEGHVGRRGGTWKVAWGGEGAHGRSCGEERGHMEGHVGRRGGTWKVMWGGEGTHGRSCGEERGHMEGHVGRRGGTWKVTWISTRAQVVPTINVRIVRFGFEKPAGHLGGTLSTSYNESNRSNDPHT